MTEKIDSLKSRIQKREQLFLQKHELLLAESNQEARGILNFSEMPDDINAASASIPEAYYSGTISAYRKTLDMLATLQEATDDDEALEKICDFIHEQLLSKTDAIADIVSRLSHNGNIVSLDMIGDVTNKDVYELAELSCMRKLLDFCAMVFEE